MSIALISHPFDVDPIDSLVAHDPWFATAALGGAAHHPGPTAAPASLRSLTIEWLVARDIDTYRARRATRRRPETGGAAAR
ncbi:hypothetical protein [Oerskovia turbata]